MASVLEFPDKANLKRGLPVRCGHTPLEDLRQIFLDEVSVDQGRYFVTFIVDMKSGSIVFTGDGKCSEALKPFWTGLRDAGAAIDVVAMDMSSLPADAVSRHLPNAVLVFDQFHVMKCFNDQLSELHGELYKNTTEPFRKQILKNARVLLLKELEDLVPNAGERDMLSLALRLDRSLSYAHYLREGLRQVWRQNGKGKAYTVLTDWIEKAERAKNGRLQQFSQVVAEHKAAILAYYDYRSLSPLPQKIINKINLRTRAFVRGLKVFDLSMTAMPETKKTMNRTSQNFADGG